MSEDPLEGGHWWQYGHGALLPHPQRLGVRGQVHVSGRGRLSRVRFRLNDRQSVIRRIPRGSVAQTRHSVTQIVLRTARTHPVPDDRRLVVVMEARITSAR